MQTITKSGGGLATTSAFVGPTNHPTTVEVAVAGLTTAEVDIDGKLKPNVPFTVAGALCSGAAGEFVYGVSAEASQIIPRTQNFSAPTNASLAADTRTVPVVVQTIGEVNRDIAEDVLGRRYTANEVAAFRAAGSKFVLTRTHR